MTGVITFTGFLFDENTPAVFADALKLVGYPVTSTTLEGLNGKGDLEIIEYCADRCLVWFTKDRDVRTKAAYNVDGQQPGRQRGVPGGAARQGLAGEGAVRDDREALAAAR